MSDLITVHATPTTPQIQAAIRQVILALSAVLTTVGANGLAGQLDGLLTYTGIVAGVIAFLWGQYATRKTAKKAAALAVAAPNGATK